MRIRGRYKNGRLKRELQIPGMSRRRMARRMSRYPFAASSFVSAVGEIWHKLENRDLRWYYFGSFIQLARM